MDSQAVENVNKSSYRRLTFNGIIARTNLTRLHIKNQTSQLVKSRADTFYSFLYGETISYRWHKHPLSIAIDVGGFIYFFPVDWRFDPRFGRRFVSYRHNETKKKKRTFLPYVQSNRDLLCFIFNYITDGGGPFNLKLIIRFARGPRRPTQPVPVPVPFVPASFSFFFFFSSLSFFSSKRNEKQKERTTRRKRIRNLLKHIIAAQMQPLLFEFSADSFICPNNFNYSVQVFRKFKSILCAPLPPSPLGSYWPGERTPTARNIKLAMKRFDNWVLKSCDKPHFVHGRGAHPGERARVLSFCKYLCPREFSTARCSLLACPLFHAPFRLERNATRCCCCLMVAKLTPVLL